MIEEIIWKYYHLIPKSGHPVKLPQIYGRQTPIPITPPYIKVVWLDDFARDIYVCSCETIPFMWIYWWAFFRIKKTLVILDTGFDYILQTWELIDTTPPHVKLPGLSNRVKNKLKKVVRK